MSHQTQSLGHEEIWENNKKSKCGRRLLFMFSLILKNITLMGQSEN